MTRQGMGSTLESFLSGADHHADCVCWDVEDANWESWCDCGLTEYSNLLRTAPPRFEDAVEELFDAWAHAHTSDQKRSLNLLCAQIYSAIREWERVAGLGPLMHRIDGRKLGNAFRGHQPKRRPGSVDGDIGPRAAAGPNPRDDHPALAGQSATPAVSLPRCRFCQRPWQPPPGVNADVAYCQACSPERRAKAAAVFGNDGKREVLVGGKYLIRVPAATTAPRSPNAATTSPTAGPSPDGATPVASGDQTATAAPPRPRK